MKLDWREPPEAVAPGLRGRFQPIVEQLRLRPGEWAVMRTYGKRASSDTAASSLRERFKDCEFVSAKEGEDWSVFGRANA